MVYEDQVRINLDMVPCSGKGDSLYVIGSPTAELTIIRFKGGRIRWRSGSYPYTSFLRNRNLQHTPRACKGILCVFRINPEEEYRLGIIGNLSPLWNNTVHIYEWTGMSHALDGVFTPEFIFFARSFPLHFDSVSSHFTLVEFKIKPKEAPDVIFLNMVSSHPSVNLPSTDCVNGKDGCFQMSSNGPDIMIEPNTMPKFPNLTRSLSSQWDINLVNPRFHLNTGVSGTETPSFLLENSKGIDHLPSEVFCTLHDGQPIMDIALVKRLSGLLAVPYIDTSFSRKDPVEVKTYLKKGQCMRFAFITKDVWRELVKKQELPHEAHNNYLNNNAKEVIELRILSLRKDMSGGIRVTIARKDEIDSMGKKVTFHPIALPSGKVAYQCENLKEPNESCPGIVVIRYLRQRQVCNHVGIY